MHSPHSSFRFNVRRGAALASAVLAAALLTGCPGKPVKQTAKPSPKPTVVTQPFSGTGTWRGAVPCNPHNSNICRSKDIVLNLFAGGTYRLQTTIRRKGGQPYNIVSNGRYTWDETGTIVTLAAKDEGARLRIEGRKMTRLPSINDEIQDADRHSGYVLYKQ